VDALVSDYHYPAPFNAVWCLHDQGMPLEKAWSLVSSGPAGILGLSDRGRLAPGLRADLCIVNAHTRAIEGTLSDGQVSHLAGGLAARFLESLPPCA